MSIITARFSNGTRFRARDGSEVWACECPMEMVFKTRDGYVLVETHWFINRKPVPKFAMPDETIQAMVESGYLSKKAAARTSVTRTARRVSKRVAIRHILRGVLQDHHSGELLEELGLQEDAKTATVTLCKCPDGRSRLEVRGELAEDIQRIAKERGVPPQAALKELVETFESRLKSVF